MFGIVRSLAFASGLALLPMVSCSVLALEPVPEKLVVLTFDDSVKSHFTVVRPILARYKFGATFFITEGFEFKTNKDDYMTWEQIAQLDRDGFEIGNHTRDHLGITEETVDRLEEQLLGISEQCQKYKISPPVSFAYPGNATTPQAFPILKEHGIRFARRGGRPEYPYEGGRGFAYEPGLDHPLLIPSAGDARPDWELADFQRAVEQAREGRVAILQFHGVPDRAHPWVHTPPDRFEQFMHYLKVNDYRVIALRDLAQYVDPDIEPRNYEEVIQDRERSLAAGIPRTNFRRPATDQELKYWLQNMLVEHRFAVAEAAWATGLSEAEVAAAAKRFQLEGSTAAKDDRIKVLPYPGGRHPRIGFLDGAMRPQRETKVSVFPPWSGGYAVVDVPEAIWVGTGAERQLLYLAHTHVPTMWSKQGTELEPLEWERLPDGVLRVVRRLPNGVEFGAEVRPLADRVEMELWLKNGTQETLTGLRVQNCVMLRESEGFAQLDNENKILRSPLAACCNQAGNRWIITGWSHCQRAWGNQYCPCLHADPQFPDCPPGETRRLKGWISFYEGEEIEREMDRLLQLTGIDQP